MLHNIEQRLILQANPNKRPQLRNETIDSKHGRRPKQYSDNNGTPSSEGTNLGDIPSSEGNNLGDMAFAQAVSARSITSSVSTMDSDERVVFND